MTVGLSLSLCIAEMVRGKAPSDVDYLVTSTKAESPEDWDSIIKCYRESYWSRFADQAEALAREYITNGCVLQPRLRTPPQLPMHNYEGLWVANLRDVCYRDYEANMVGLYQPPQRVPVLVDGVIQWHERA